MSIADSFEKRYYKLPEEWYREFWGGDEVDVCKIMHYGKSFCDFVSDMKAVAVSVKIDEENSIYKYIFIIHIYFIYFLAFAGPIPSTSSRTERFSVFRFAESIRLTL